MTRPGDRLRACAARACSADTMARLVDPVIADIQAEHSQAVRNGRVWRSRWVRLAGYIAFAKVFVMCEWSPVEDARPLTRVVGFSLGAAVLATAAMVWPAYQRFQWTPLPPTQVDAWRIAAFLLPQALAVSIPVGLMIGVAIGLAGRKVSVRLATAIVMMALACSIGSVANMGWVLPNANQAFRTAMFQRVSHAPPPKGDAELTFPELDRQMARSGTFPVDSNGLDEFTRLQVAYHTRWALSFATLVLTMFALSVAGCTLKRWKIGAAVVAAFFGYYALLYVCRLSALNHDLAPPVAAWLPNAVFALLSLKLIALSARRRRDHEEQTAAG